jgi:hypothetical protein
MKDCINKVGLQGRVYDFTIAEKVTSEKSKKPGTSFIGGKLDIATDEDCMNIVTVEFTYVTETTSTGKQNATYGVLKNIINNGKTVLADGKEAATKVKIDSACGLNDFYSDRNGKEELVSVKRPEGGFVSIVSKLDDDETKRNTFTCDMLINGVNRVEADEERHIDKDYVVVKGAIFNFRKAFLPIEFIVKSEGGMKYFESLGASKENLVFTKVWGNINNETTITRKEEESAFGEPVIKEFKNTRREWVITGTSKPDAVYEIGDAEHGITIEELKEKIAEREVYLADVKKRADEYKASKNAGSAASTAGAAAPAAAGGFNF